MNILDLRARLESLEAGRPLPRGASIPLPRVGRDGTRVLSLVRMGGEHLPWGFAWGAPDEEPRVITVPEPRNQDRAAYLAIELGRCLDAHLGHPEASVESDVHPSARRLVVANASHLELLHQFGLRWRYAKKGDVDRVAALQRAGRSALWVFHEHRRPGQLRVVDAAALLSEVYVMPAEPLRLAHLGFALALLETEGGWEARRAAATMAEQRSVGATMDPDVENLELERLVEEYRRSASDAVATDIHDVLARELKRRHGLTARALRLLDTDPRPDNRALDSLRARAMERWTYGYFNLEQRIADELASGTDARVPDLDTDRSVARAAARYFDHEDCASLVDEALLLGDAERIDHAIAEGNALRGRVVRVVDEGPSPRCKRPVWTVEHDATLPLRIAKAAASRPSDSASSARFVACSSTPPCVGGSSCASCRASARPRTFASARSWCSRACRASGSPRRSPSASTTTADRALGSPTARRSRVRPFHRARTKTSSPSSRGCPESEPVPQHHLHDRRQQTLNELLEAVNARDPLVLVSSPPGSGKTFMLERGAVLAYHRRQRVAVATQTRTQADDVCRRLARAFPRIPVVRFLAGKDEAVDLGASVRNVRETRELPSGPCIVVATAAKWELVDVPPCDVVFVDEAWQMTWADLMLVGRVAPRFVLIGDPGQIEPTVTLDTARWETLARAPHRAAPDVILADGALPTRHLRLPVTTRLPHDTTAIVRAFYDFRFDSWAAPGDRRLVLAPGLLGDGVDRVLERLRGGSIAALTLPTADAGPPAEEDRELAAHAASIVQRLLARGARVQTEEGDHALSPSDVGMVATHRVMNARLVEALGPLASAVRVDTPERWQGLERRVMIAVHPLSGVTEPSSFDLSTGRLCVMTSRHSVACVLVTRDHVGDTVRTHLPTADQPVGRPDAAGRGLARHRAVWSALEQMSAVIAP